MSPPSVSGTLAVTSSHRPRKKGHIAFCTALASHRWRAGITPSPVEEKYEEEVTPGKVTTLIEGRSRRATGMLTAPVTSRAIQNSRANGHYSREGDATKRWRRAGEMDERKEAIAEQKQ